MLLVNFQMKIKMLKFEKIF